MLRSERTLQTESKLVQNISQVFRTARLIRHRRVISRDARVKRTPIKHSDEPYQNRSGIILKQIDSNRIVDGNYVESVRLGVRTHAKSTNTLDGFENNTACCDLNANARVAMIDTHKRQIYNINMSLFSRIIMSINNEK